MVVVRALLVVLVLASACAAQAPEPATPPGVNPIRAAGPVGLPPATDAEPAPPPPVGEKIADGRPSLTPPPTFVTKPPSDPPPAAEPTDSRRLARPSPRVTSQPAGERPKLFDIQWDSLPVDPATSAAAVAFVVGLFLLFVAVLKRATPKSQRVLPAEVASVVGRIPLGGKQTAHLLKVGAKLVLVHITPEGAKPLTEVTEPAEVNRLLGLCEQGGEHSASSAFQDVFEKLATEPAVPGFLGAEATLLDRQQLAAAYAKTPGGRSGA